MKILGRTQPLSRYPIDRCLAVLKRLGFDGVEICLENEDIRPEALTDERVGRVQRQVERLGLAPFSVSYHADYIHNDEELDRTLRAIARTPDFGTDVFVLSGAGAGAGRSGPAEWSRMVRRTETLVEAAGRAGIVLAKEFEPGFICGCTADLHRLFAEIPSGHLAANLDLGHVFLCDEDPLAAIRSLKGKVVHCHVENMAAGVHDHLLPHEGDMDLQAYVVALKEIGFTGGLALDLYKHDYERVAPEAIRFLRQCID